MTRAAPVPLHTARPRTTPIVVPSSLRWAGGIVGLLLLWQAVAMLGVADGFVLAPGRVLAAVLDPEYADVLASSAAATFGAAAAGLAIGGVLAGAAAVLAAQVRALRVAIGRVAALANSAPWVAIGPVVLVIAGRESGPVAIAAIAVYFPIFVAVTAGMGASAGPLREAFAVGGATPAATLVHLVLPRALPSIADGLKLAVPAAVAGTIYGEWYGAPEGLGVLLITAMQGGDAELLWSASTVAVAGGLLAYAVAGGVQVALRHRFGAGVGGAGEERSRAHPVRAAVEVVVGAALLVGVWQLWITVSGISPLVAPTPGPVFADLVGNAPAHVASVLITLRTAGLALLLGLATGAGLAVLARRVAVLESAIVPAMVVLAAAPLVAVLPLLARILGYTDATLVAVSAILVVLPGFVYTRSGLEAALPAHLDVARTLGARAGARLTAIALPSALPHIATGVRIAASSAVVATVVGESLIGRSGLGVDFTYSYRLLQLAPAFAAAILIVVVSLAVFAVSGALERAVQRRWGFSR